MSPSAPHVPRAARSRRQQQYRGQQAMQGRVTQEMHVADRTTCIGRLERVEDGRAIVTVDGRIRVIGLDELRAIEEVEGR